MNRLQLLLLTILLFSATEARAEETWSLHLLGQWVDTTGDALAEIDDGFGFTAAVERRLTDRWGVELAVGRQSVEGSATATSEILGFQIVTRLESQIDWTPISLGANLHLTPASATDFVIGLHAGWAFVDDLEIETSAEFPDGFGIPGLPTLPIDSPPLTTSLEADDTWFYGLHLGASRAFASGWAVEARLDWSLLEPEITAPAQPDGPFPSPGPQFADAELNPLAVGVGIVRRW